MKTRILHKKKNHFFVFIIYLNFNKKKYNEIILKKIIIKSIYIRFSTQRIWPDEIIKTGAGITFSFYFLWPLMSFIWNINMFNYVFCVTIMRLIFCLSQSTIKKQLHFVFIIIPKIKNNIYMYLNGSGCID